MACRAFIENEWSNALGGVGRGWEGMRGRMLEMSEGEEESRIRGFLSNLSIGLTSVRNGIRVIRDISF